MSNLGVVIAGYRVRWRTFAVSACVMLMGVVQEVGIYQVREFLALFISDSHLLGLMMIVLPLLFAGMRLVSSGAAVERHDAGPALEPGKHVDDGG